MSTGPRLLSVQTGRPQMIADDAPWVTSIYKTPVPGPVLVRQGNLEGDGQADLTVHGGPDKAICVYSADHYAVWRDELALPAFGPGAFGENFTVTGLTERDVSIGDRWTIGGAVLEVSQPRGPCWKVARRWQVPDFPKRMIASGRTGWYLRVVSEGTIEADQSIEIVSRPDPQWTISHVNDLAYARTEDVNVEQLARLAASERLAISWREWLTKRLAAVERRQA